MRILIGLLALSLLGADGSPSPSPSTPPLPASQIVYQLRVVELTGVDWRADVFSKLQSVTRQGNATIWTAPKEVGERIVKKATSQPGGGVLAAPKVMALSGNVAHISAGSNRNFVTGVTRVADGPVNHASTVAWVPKVEHAREGLTTTLRGRKLDQGVLAQIVLSDSRVGTVHSVGLSEVQEPGKDASGEKRWDKMMVKIQVPEYTSSEIAGEWLIPTDGVLLVSLGAHTVAEADGKAGVRERVAVVEAHATEVPTATPAAGRIVGRSFEGELTSYSVPLPALPNTPASLAMPVAVPLPVSAPLRVAASLALPVPMPMPVPSAPSRSLPQPLNAEGAPVALPPLPEDHHTPPTTLPDSSAPCATPQTRHHAAPAEPAPVGRSTVHDNAVSVDVDSTRASYEVAPCPFSGAPACPMAGSCPMAGACPAGHDCCEGAPAVKSKPTTATFPTTPATPAARDGDVKGASFRIPLSGTVTLEIRATALPTPATTSPLPTQKWSAPAKPQ